MNTTLRIERLEIIFLIVVCLLSTANCVAVFQDETVNACPEVKILPVDQADNVRSDKKIRLRIVSFNDFHGNYREKSDALGAAKFLTAIKQYANDYPNDYPTSVCTFCVGDNFAGTALSYYSTLDLATHKEKQNPPLTYLFSLADVTAACIGNHEFDWGATFLEDHLAKATVTINGKAYPAYSSSNILNKATKRPPGNVFEYDVISPDGTNYMIAVITLTTMETVTKSLPGTMDSYVFERPSVCAKRLMETIKDVDAFIFMTHMSSVQDDVGTITFLGDEEEMRELIKLKPLAIITAHSHKFVSGKIDEIPIIQAGCYGNGLASINFIIDSETRTAVVESQNFKKLLPDRERILPDSEMKKVITEAAGACHFSTVGTVCTTLRKNKATMNDLGSLVVKALATSFPETTQRGWACNRASARRTDPLPSVADLLEKNSRPWGLVIQDEPVLAFQHGGGIRADLSKGLITEEDCFNVLPFESRMSLCRLPGSGILQLLREGLVNKNGCLQCASLMFYYDSANAKRPDFKQVAFTANGKRHWIEPEKEYWVALDNFIVSGGDGYSRSIFENHVVIADGPSPRDVLVRYFKEDLKGDIVLPESDRPAFVIMPSTLLDFQQPPQAPESLQRIPQTLVP